MQNGHKCDPCRVTRQSISEIAGIFQACLLIRRRNPTLTLLVLGHNENYG